MKLQGAALDRHLREFWFKWPPVKRRKTYQSPTHKADTNEGYNLNAKMSYEGKKK